MRNAGSTITNFPNRVECLQKCGGHFTDATYKAPSYTLFPEQDGEIATNNAIFDSISDNYHGTKTERPHLSIDSFTIARGKLIREGKTGSSFLFTSHDLAGRLVYP